MSKNKRELQSSSNQPTMPKRFANPGLEADSNPAQNNARRHHEWQQNQRPIGQARNNR